MLIFCMWVAIDRGTKLVESFLVGVDRHTQACLKYFKIMNQQYLKNEVMYKVDFSTWVETCRGNILIQSFQVVAWVGTCLGMPKVLQNKESAISQEGGDVST